MSESLHQQALFEFFAYAQSRIPELQYAFHVPNGGQRNARVGLQLKREGVKRGVPDIIIPVPRQSYVGMVIELKFGKNKLSTEQQDWLSFFAQQHWHCIVAYSWQDAALHVVRYFEHPPEEFGLHNLV